MLFGGNVTGKYDEIVPNKKIVQTWRLKQWPSGHFSNVVMELEERVSRGIQATQITVQLTIYFPPGGPHRAQAHPDVDSGGGVRGDQGQLEPLLLGQYSVGVRVWQFSVLTADVTQQRRTTKTNQASPSRKLPCSSGCHKCRVTFKREAYSKRKPKIHVE